MTDLLDRPFLYREAADDEPDETDRGLVYDLGTLDRRRMLQTAGVRRDLGGHVRHRRLHAGRQRVTDRRAPLPPRAPVRRPRAAPSSPRRPPDRSPATAPTARTS